MTAPIVTHFSRHPSTPKTHWSARVTTAIASTASEFNHGIPIRGQLWERIAEGVIR